MRSWRIVHRSEQNHYHDPDYDRFATEAYR